jgi:hypothetical protein
LGSQGWLGTLLNPKRGYISDALDSTQSYFQAHFIKLRSCTGNSQNSLHWEITETPRTTFYHQLNRDLWHRHNGDVTKWFRDLVLINKLPTESVHCWRNVDGQPQCDGQASELQLYISIPVMLIIELGDRHDSENVWNFPKNIRPLTAEAESTDGVVYDIVGRAFFSDEEQHFTTCFTPNSKDIYHYDGIAHGGHAVLNHNAKMSSHLIGSSVNEPRGFRTYAVIYHLRGGTKAQARYTYDQTTAAERLHPILDFTSGTNGSLPTVSLSGSNITRLPDEDRYWLKNPHTTKSAEFQSIERTASDPKRKISGSKGHLWSSSDEGSPHKLIQPKIRKRARYHVDSSSDDDFMSAASQIEQQGRESSSPASKELHSSQESAFPFDCRCGAQGDGHVVSDHQNVIQCENCQNWSHIACQRGGRASNLRVNQKIVCDACAPLTLVSRVDYKTRRYVISMSENNCFLLTYISSTSRRTKTKPEMKPRISLEKRLL